MPAYNEATTLAAVVRQVRETLPTTDLVVIDDGSTDATARVAAAAGAEVLSLPFNLGVGGAMRAGYRFAASRGYEAAVQVDADGQHDPADVPALVAALDRADVVIGARFAGRGDYVVRGPRRWAMRLLAWTLSRRAGEALTDVTSGFRAAGPRGIAQFASDYPVEYLGDTVEALVLALRAGLTVTQVPVAMAERAGGVPSQTALRATAYLGRTFLILLLASVRKAAPPWQPRGTAGRVHEEAAR